MPPTAGVVAPTMAELAESIAGLLIEFERNPQHPALVGKPEGNPVQIRPAFPDPQTFTQRLIQGVQANAGRYAEGVQKPRANFKTEALKANGAWKAGVQAAVAGDRFAAGMGKVDEDEAIQTAVTVGAQTFVQGVTGRAAKITRVMGDVAPKMAAAVQTVRGLANTTDADREARAIAMIRAARAVGLSRRGGK